MRTVLDAAVAVHIVMRTEKVAGFISRLERPGARTRTLPRRGHQYAVKASASRTYGQADRAHPTERGRRPGRCFRARLARRLVNEAMSMAIVHGNPVYDLLTS